MRSLLGQDQEFQSNAAPSPTGSQGMTLVGNSDKDGTTNSDLAFYGNMAFSGNYDGFRILDIRSPQPRVIVDHRCRGPQNDVSVYKIRGRLYLFQSIDTPQSAEDCTSVDNPLWPTDNTKRTPGFEGIRQFDVTNPAKPRFVNAYQTACGSHTHTLVPGKKSLHIYISSYPLGSGITPGDYEGPLPRCESPHSQDLDHRHQALGRRERNRPREGPEHRHHGQPWVPGLPRHPGAHAEGSRGGLVRGRHAAMEHRQPGQPDLR